MLKGKMMAAMVLMAACGLAEASTAPSEKAGAPISSGVDVSGNGTEINLSYSLTKNGQVVAHYDGVALSGDAQSFEQTSERGYASSASRQGSELKIVPGTVKTGLLIKLTPGIDVNGKPEFTVNAESSSLISITSYTEDGLTIQSPTVDGYALTQTLHVKSGEKIVVPLDVANGKDGGKSSSDKYQIIASATLK